MKQLNFYIVEKLKINKDSGDEYGKFCRALKIEQNRFSKELFTYYKDDKKCEDQLSGYFDDNQLHSSCFDALLMLSVMLIQDKMKASDIMNIGFKSYKGNNNPYDYSWFGDENEKGETVLEIFQSLYKGNNDDWFKNYFEEFFSLVLNAGVTSIDDVWYMWDKMGTPESEWAKKEEEEWI